MLDSLPQPETAGRNSYPPLVSSVANISRPEPGRSLGGTVAKYDGPVRSAVSVLEEAFRRTAKLPALLEATTRSGPGGVRESDSLRLAWLCVSVVIAHAISRPQTKASPIEEALHWFFPSDHGRAVLACASQQYLAEADNELAAFVITDEVVELLPYILEPHGHVSRSSHENTLDGHKRREAKRDAGIYYTPSDVAAFMAKSVLSSPSNTWIDPACGTGVFLRAAIRECDLNSWSSEDRYQFATRNIYGIDQSALATDLCSFVLLAECKGWDGEVAPFDAWRRIKQNIVCMDALLLSSSSANLPLDEISQLVSAAEVFPALCNGRFDCVVMNPPYTSIEVDENLRRNWRSYSDLAIGATADVHLAFAEMLDSLSSSHGAGAAVLPISIGTNTTKSYVLFRDTLWATRKAKEFLFFDREPQAIFGDDIRTRNVILFARPRNGEGDVFTSRLLKWTGVQRPNIFSRNRLVGIDRKYCKSFVPKLGSAAEAEMYIRLRSSGIGVRASRCAPQYGRLNLADAALLGQNLMQRSLLVSGTAYNFLNAFFATALPENPPKPYSNSPVSMLVYESAEMAFAAYAILASRFSFWLWHVEGDGFHVNSDFLNRLPFWAAFDSPSAARDLSQLGAEMWDCAASHVAGAVNGGRQTYSYHCDFSHPASVSAEHVIAEALSIPGGYFDALSKFVTSVVSIDGKQRSRTFKKNQ